MTMRKLFTNASFVLVLVALFAAQAFATNNVPPVLNFHGSTGSSGQREDFVGMYQSPTNSATLVVGGTRMTGTTNGYWSRVYNSGTNGFTNYSLSGGTAFTVYATDFFRSTSNTYLHVGYFNNGTTDIAATTLRASDGSLFGAWGTGGTSVRGDSATTNYRFNDAVQVPGGSDFAIVGFTDDGATGTGDIYFEIQVSNTGAISGSASKIGVASHTQEAFAIEPVPSGGTITAGHYFIGGYDDDGSDQDFYFAHVDDAGALQSSVANNGWGSTYDNAVIRDIVINGDVVYVIGYHSSPSVGFVARLDASNSFNVDWEYSTTATGVKFYSGALNTDDDLIVVGTDGTDLLLSEITDGTTSASVDWSKAYDTDSDNGTAEVGLKIFSTNGTSPFTIVGTIGDGGAETDGLIAGFAAPATGPVTATTPSPSDGATDQSESGVTLTWSDDGNGDAAATYDVYFDAGTNPPTTILGDDIGSASQATGALSLGTTYYWRVVTFDADGDSSIGPVWSFSTPSADPIRLLVAADLNTATWLDTAYAGFGGNGTDGYDSGIDVPKPPFSTGDLRMYIENTGLSGYEQILREEIRSSTSVDDSTLVFTLKAVISTAGTDLPLSLSFDASTDNADGYGMVLYTVALDTFQNLASVTTFDTTVNDGETHEFALLLGDITPPALTFNLPDTSGGNREVFPRSSTTTMDVGFDNSNPIKSVIIQFDSSSADADNWITLTNANPIYLPTDDPRDGISNPSLSFDWNPLYDDGALFSSSDLFPLAQLRFISEDWAGNKDTIDVDIEIGPDEFAYPDDAPNATASAGWGAGWHLISLPIEPDAPTDPDSVFAEISGGVFNVFDGDVPASSVELLKGYWLLLDNAEATSPATIYGSVDTLKAFKMSGIGWHLIGPDIRAAEVTANLTFDDIEVSSDSSTWVDMTTDAGTLVGTTLYSYDNDAGAQVDETPSDFTSAMTPGWGYQILTKNATIYVRMSHSFVNSDAVTPPMNEVATTASEDELEWFVPITISMRPLEGGPEYFVETISGVGGKTGASDGVDNFDKAEPPRPPTGKYARIVIDHQDEVAWSRYFVVDYRAPFSVTTSEASWDFVARISESCLVMVGFDGTELEEKYGIPESFRLSAVVNLPDGQTIEYADILQTREIVFPYEGGGDVSITVTATLNGVESIGTQPILPTEYALEGAYPNPFNPTTNLRVALPEASHLTVKVFNVLGKEVATLADGQYKAGFHMLSFNGESLASGVYFVRATVPGHLSDVRKLVLTR